MDEKLLKLFELSRSSNEHEAAAAQRKINQYLIENDLTWEDLLNKKEPEQPEETLYETKYKQYQEPEKSSINFIKVAAFIAILVIIYFALVWIYNLLISFTNWLGIWWSQNGLFAILGLAVIVYILVEGKRR